jgi:5-methylcytosine-specific restriction endonuclease McrA
VRKFSPCGKSGNYYQRAKKYGCEYVPGITLKKLIQRDGLQCKICGKMCNPDDHSWANHSGPMRPSVDHIIPLAKGGPHDWDNVQVAHIICNSAKGDKVVNE